MPDQPTVYTNCRVKEYPKSLVKQVATGAIFPMIPGASKPRSYSVSRPGHAKDKERSIKMSQQRAKSKVRDLALCNMDKFDHFLTWTIDPDLLDRYDPKAVYHKLRTFLGNAVHRKEFSYLLVPEYHKKKAGEDKPAIHLHGLCHLGKVRIERARDKLGRRRTDNEGRPVYNMLDWKYGFSSCVPLDENYERAANYVAKYITRGNGGKIFGKWYLHSRDLVKGPDIFPLDPENYDEFRDEEKLKAHIQHEGEIYSSLRVLSEEFPKI